MPGSVIGLVWPPSGIALAALLWLGRPVWPAFFIGPFFSTYGYLASSHPQGLALRLALGQSLANTAEILVLGLLVGRLGGPSRALATLRGVVWFGVGSALTEALIAALALSLHLWAGVLPADDFGLVWSNYFISNTVSVLLLSPFLFTVAQGLDRRRPRSIAAWLAGGLLLATAAWQACLATGTDYQVVFEAGAFVLVGLASVWRGRLGGTGAAFVLGAVAIGATARGGGPFAVGRSEETFLLLQVFLAALAYTGLILSAVLSEREAAKRDVARGAEQMQAFLSRQLVGPAGAVGEDYLRALAEHVATCFSARYALVGEVVDGGDRVRTLAVWAGGRLAEDFEYDLAGTPCANVVGQQPCVYPQRVQQCFPDDALLGQMGVESYCGTPIYDSQGRPLGILAVLDDQPMALPDERTLSLLDLFAERASAEIQRLRAERALAASRTEYRDLVEQVNSMVLRWRPDGIITFANRFAAEFFGYAPDELVGRHLVETIVPRVDSQGLDLSGLIDDLVADPERYAANQNENVKRDGSIAWVAWTNHAIRNSDGQVVEVFSTGQDMTAVRASQDELRAAAERVRATLDRSPFGAFTYELGDDGALVMIAYNDAADRLLGVDCSRFVGLTMEQAFPALARTELPKRYREVAEQGGTYTDPQVDYHEQGISGSFEIYAYQIAPRQMAVLFHDVSERREFEAQIYRRNRELALLNRVMAATSGDLDPAAITQVACRELADAFDVPRASAGLLAAGDRLLRVTADVREPGAPAFPSEIDVDQVPRLMAAMRAGQPILATSDADWAAAVDDYLRGPRPGQCGMFLPLMVENQAVGAIALVATTDRAFTQADRDLAWAVARQIASALALSRLTTTRRRLLAAIEQTPESIVIANPQGVIEYVNATFEQATGYSRAEAVGRRTNLLKSGEHDFEFYQRLWDTITNGGIWEGRLVNRRRDGSLFTESAVIGPVRDEAGQTTNYIAVKRDISAELDREERYRQSQRLESIGRLAGGIAHDFNNILTAVMGHAEEAAELVGAEHAARAELTGVLQGAERAAALTRQLLAFARRQVIKPVALDLGALATDLSRMVQRLIGEDIVLTVSVPAEPVTVLADASQLEQFIINLAVNARDAMPSGGELRIIVERAGHRALLKVADNGQGIPDDIMPRIFDPFFTTKADGSGTGLGLATCYGIAEQSDGQISCESRVGVGTTFTLDLPLTSAAPTTVAPAASRVRSGNETILLAEDEPVVRSVTTRLLQSLGYSVIEADSGARALELAAAHPGEIHLLVSDMVMPGMGGLALAEALGTARPSTKVLFISGYIGDHAFQDGEAFAERHHLHKPFSRAQLAEKIREVLDGG